eukprot:CAMPEP_0197176886 /NCGR_PEP_ID=MMETSP1423-20130617/2670_1 /TAXON_ID=476441 /ORGANISM="Pseudo-nitzschia heimii, Strain UNC1101" /LENGTH=540 /DNA_ID=CAMNT_0042626329 /DNA_START=1 /DNA_END=1623 /DNA_ORIENTATION=+
MNWCGPCDADILVDEAETILECNYDTNVTSLYQAIEEEAWNPILTFVKTQKWSSMAFTKDALSPESQARTWVTRFDPNGKVRWSQLPLHAAIIFRAPRKVVKALIELYPLSVQCSDDQRMLPLHLAFRVGANDDIMNLLMEFYPDALLMKNLNGKVPYAIVGRDVRQDYNETVRQIVKLITRKVTATEKKSSRLEINDLEDAIKQQSRLVTIIEDNNQDLVHDLSVAKRELDEFKEHCRTLEEMIAKAELSSVRDTVSHNSDSHEISTEKIASTTTPDPKDTNVPRIRQEETSETIRNFNHRMRSRRQGRDKLPDTHKKKDFRMISSEKFDFGNTSLDTIDTETTASQCTSDSPNISVDVNSMQQNKEPDKYPDTMKRKADRILRTNEFAVADALFDPNDANVSMNQSTKASTTSPVNKNLIQHGDDELEVILNDIKQTISKSSDITMEFETKEKLVNSKPSFVMRESAEDIIDINSLERTLSADKEAHESQKDSHTRKYRAEEGRNVDLTDMAVKIHDDHQHHALYDIIQTIVTSYQTE